MQNKGYFSCKPLLEALFPLTGAAIEELEAALDAYDSVGRELVAFPDATPFLAAIGEALQFRSPYESWEGVRARQVAHASSYSGKLNHLAVVYRTQPPTDEEYRQFRESADSFLLACAQVMDDPYRRATT